MDLVPDHVLSAHVLSPLSFRDALRIYSSCRRFRRLLSDRMVPRLDVLLHGGIEAAVREGFLDVVEVLVDERDERGFRDWCGGMAWAANEGHRDLVEYFVGRGASDWDRGMASAAWGGCRDLVVYFEGKGASNWDWSMEWAAKRGHWDIVEYFVWRGASSWNMGMAHAAFGGYEGLVEYFVEKGASDWNWGRLNAVNGGHPDLVEYFDRKLLNRQFAGLLQFYLIEFSFAEFVPRRPGWTSFPMTSSLSISCLSSRSLTPSDSVLPVGGSFGSSLFA